MGWSAGAKDNTYRNISGLVHEIHAWDGGMFLSPVLAPIWDSLGDLLLV